RRAKEILIDLLDELQGPDLRTAIGSLRLLAAEEAAPHVVAFLRTEDPLLRREVLHYLAEVRPARVLEQVLPAVAADRAGHDLNLWLRYLTAAAPANTTAAETLLPFLGENHVDREQQVAVVEALATVAPKEH